MPLKDSCIKMYQPHSIENWAKILSFSWKHSAFNSLPANIAWFLRDGWHDGWKSSEIISPLENGKKSSWQVPPPGEKTYVFLFFLFPRRLCFFVWIHYVTTYVLLYLWQRGCPTGLQSCIFKIPFQQVNSSAKRLSLLVVFTTRCKRNTVYSTYIYGIGLYHIDILIGFYSNFIDIIGFTIN